MEIKESLNNDGPQVHQYQQHKQSPLTLTYLEKNPQHMMLETLFD